MSDYSIVLGDCRGAMRAMATGSVDAIVTDPPYGISFMGKKWDYEIPGTDAFVDMHRVLKDGGRLLCFAGSRTFHRMWCNIEDAGFTIEDTIAWMYGSGFPKHRSKLKPAYEPICVARKGGVSELNIDAARIAGVVPKVTQGPSTSRTSWDVRTELQESNPHALGRWPANVALDEEAAAMLDAQSGELQSGALLPGHKRGQGVHAADGGYVGGGTIMRAYPNDSGGASRFFYCAKADRAEREFGLEGATKRNGGSTAKGFTEDVERGLDRNRPVANNHPTVKPVDLMRWLVRLVTIEGQTVLDPFCGSGTTGVAAIMEGRNFVGCELNADYAEIARRRIGNAPLNLFGAA